MNRQTVATMMAQYKTVFTSGEGRVEWEEGVHSYAPSVVLRGRCAQAGTPTPDSPQEILHNNGVFFSQGRNLFNLYGAAALANSSATQLYPISFVEDAVQINQSMYYHGRVYFAGVDMFLIAGSYRLSATCYAPSSALSKTLYYGVEGVSNTLALSAYDTWVPIKRGITVSQSGWYRLHIQLAGGKDKNTDMGLLVKEIQLERGTVYHTYEPYHNGGAAIAPDLYAVPGTDYVDEWDTQTGRGVQRCGVIAAYNGEPISTPYISTTGELSTGATVVYGLPVSKAFQTQPEKLILPAGYGQIYQVAGDVADAPLSVGRVTHT